MATDWMHEAVLYLLMINDKNNRYEIDPEQAARDEIDAMSNCELLDLLSAIERNK